ncbi:hypothetical protein [Halorientalis persicus]|uniref:hypothetical protein n=1 Tax=Halorientalis persicus TaxID=1367881 RepID=UPI000B89A7BC|nr:hypothetical protein [Halorientalis persicus]
MVRPDPEKLERAADHAENITDRGISTTNTRALVEMRNALIRLENVANEAREQVIEPALDDKIEVGDTVEGVQRHGRERPTVTDNATALEMLEDAGVDLAEVVSVEPYSFVDAFDETEVDPSEIIRVRTGHVLSTGD